MSEKIILRAVIPTHQYANLQPEIEVEAETYDEALAIAEGRLAQIWNKYAEPDKKLGGERKLLKAFCGGEIYYDEVNHLYTNEAGEIYLSGSVYASTFKKPFDADKVAEMMARKYKVTPEEILAMWALKGEASRDLGNAIHRALQLEEQYRALGVTMGKDSMHDHPILNHAVQGFYDAHKDEKAFNEVLVVDHEKKHAGQIDRLLITKRKHCRVQDFKTNANISKDLDVYWKQLEFYAEILKAGGWTVEGLDILHYNGEWKEYSHEISQND